MSSTTARRPAGEKGSDLGSDLGLMPFIRSADAPRPAGCEAQRVTTTAMRPLNRSDVPPADSSAADRRPLRVLLTTDWWEPVVNGVVASVQTLRAQLIALGCDVRVLTLSQGIRSRADDGVYRLGSLSASMVYDRARIGMPANRAVLREIMRWRPDVVHSQVEFSTFVWARRISRTLGVPLVHTYHTIYEDYTHYYSPSVTVGRKVVASFSRRALAGTDAVIVPTAKVSRLLTGYGVRRPLHVIPTGLDLERFRPAGSVAELEDAAALRARLGIRPEQKVLVSVSRLAQEKNLDEVLDHLAAADRSDAVLVVVGDGPYREQLEARARRLGITDRTRFVGVVDPSEVPRWYRMADLFVSASLSETQGLTYIEALACGLPLLCRRDPSLTGVVLDGVTGYQIDGSAQFRSRLARLLDEPALRERMAVQAHAHARSTCGAETFGHAVLEVYRQACARRAARPIISRRMSVA